MVRRIATESIDLQSFRTNASVRVPVILPTGAALAQSEPDVVTVRISGPYPGDETVTCVIPGHERSGHEVVAEELRVDTGELSFEFSGVCGYSAHFEYGSD